MAVKLAARAGAGNRAERLNGAPSAPQQHRLSAQN